MSTWTCSKSSMMKNYRNNFFNFIIKVGEVGEVSGYHWFDILLLPFFIDGAVPNKFYADARYEFPEVEKRIRGLIAYVPQRARRLTPAARNFLELISKHVEVVLIGSESNIKQHITNILNTWNRLSPSDKKSYGEQFPDSSIILDSKCILRPPPHIARFCFRRPLPTTNSEKR